MNFTVGGFGISDGNAAPTDPVTGTIAWDAASATSDIDSLVSISLTIDGHVYTLGEVGFVSPFGPGSSVIGGTASEVLGVSGLTDDFRVVFSQQDGTPSIFTFASSGLSGIWTSSSFTRFSITANQAPLPGTLALLLAAGAGFAALRRRT